MEHSLRVENKSLRQAEEFKYLGCDVHERRYDENGDGSTDQSLINNTEGINLICRGAEAVLKGKALCLHSNTHLWSGVDHDLKNILDTSS